MKKKNKTRCRLYYENIYLYGMWLLQHVELNNCKSNGKMVSFWTCWLEYNEAKILQSCTFLSAASSPLLSAFLGMACSDCGLLGFLLGFVGSGDYLFFPRKDRVLIIFRYHPAVVCNPVCGGDNCSSWDADDCHGDGFPETCVEHD